MAETKATAKKKTKSKQLTSDELMTDEALSYIVQIAYAAEREAQLIDHIANTPDDFEMPIWEFVIRSKREGWVKKAREIAKGKVNDDSVFTIVVKALL